MLVVSIVLVFVMVKILLAPTLETMWERIKEENETAKELGTSRLRTYQPKAYSHEGQKIGDAIGYGISQLKPRDVPWLWIISILVLVICPPLGLIMIVSLIILQAKNLGPYSEPKEKPKALNYKEDNPKYEQQTC